MDDFDFIKNPYINFNVYECASDVQCSQDLTTELTIVHLNIRSIKKNWDSFLVVFESISCKMNIAGVILTEVNITSDEVSLYEIEGFDVFSSLRDGRRGGGILIFIKENFNFTVEDLNMCSTESIIGNLHIEDKLVRIIAIYRPPDKNILCFLEELEFLVKMCHKKVTMIIGDININLKNKNCINTIRYKEVMFSHGYMPLINSYTREEIKDGNLVQSCLDHILYNGQFNLMKSFIIKIKLSDHYMIGLTIKGFINSPTKQPADQRKDQNRGIEYLDNKKVDLQINNYNWVNLLEEHEPNALYRKLSSIFKDIYDNSKGIYKKVGRKGENNWMNIEIYNMILERDRAFKKWKSCPTNIHYKANYKTLRNKTVQAIRKAKYIYFNDKISKIDGKRSLWKEINRMTGRSKERSDDDIILSHLGNNMKKSNIHDICNNFLKQFINGVKEAPCNCGQNFYTDLKINNSYSIFVPDPSEESIEKIIKELRNKGPGHDRIRIRDLKVNTVLLPVITTLIKRSLTQGVVPEGLKVALVRPIHKGGPFKDLVNYRPISLLPAINKIMEKYVAGYLISFLKKHDIISKYQYGFMQGRGTKDALEKFSDIVNKNLDKNNKLIVTYVDYKKAFDSVSIPILISKLQDIGIRGCVLKWFKSYLFHRSIRVKCKNCISNSGNVKYGVPQGSILGPILFLVYINSIFKCVVNCKALLYADDVVLISGHRDLNSALNNMQNDINNITKWSHDHELTINMNKSKVMSIANNTTKVLNIYIKIHENECLHRNMDKLTCKCKTMEQVSQYKYLGVIIDQTFKFKEHCDALCSKLRKISYQMYHISECINENVKKIIYFALVESILRYGITIWGNNSQSHKRKLYSIQNRIVKIIYFDGNDDKKEPVKTIGVHTKDIYKSLNILPVDKLMTYILVVDNYFTDKNKKLKEDAHVMQKRNVNYYDVPRYVNESGGNRMKVAVPKIFNQLPKTLHGLRTFNEVKRELRNYLLEI